ncbi:hypothetical protein MN032_01335 [Agromyces atrinae]|uniref:hypothetical protein n=1 Tax=Agromyces atrinae TaxID=592376 RepID=UPI001F5759B5|nr:hypothetical protein [Agromyces atrinae]MCI2956319.1 hypothetical protein [Agromyces atrinae]
MTRALAAPLAAVLLVVLAACASPAPTPTPTAEPATPTPTAASGPLTCDDVASLDTVAAALTRADLVAPTPVVAVQPSSAFDTALLRGAGGLACSWRAGEGQLVEGSGDGEWAYVQVSILPGAAAQYAPVWAGDAPSTETRDVGEVTASTAEGETGWVLSAPVGDAWVQVALRASGLTGDSSFFEGVAPGAVGDAVADVASEVFAAIDGAAPERLTWPALTPRSGDAACTGGLDESGIVSALQVDPSSVLDYAVVDARATAPDSFESAVASAAGVFTCDLRTDGAGSATIAVVRGFASELDVMRSEPDTSSAFSDLPLEGAVEGEGAIVANRSDGPASPVYLTVGDTLYQVYSDGAEAVAEAIIAQTR